MRTPLSRLMLLAHKMRKQVTDVAVQKLSASFNISPVTIHITDVSGVVIDKTVNRVDR